MIDTRSGLGGSARLAARGLVRGYAMATAPLRPAPDFIMLGGKRTGSTSLYYGLLQHPSMAPLFPSSRRLPMAEDRKNVRGFDRETCNPYWYRSHFQTSFARRRLAASTGAAATGECTPWYLFADGAAEKAQRIAPEAKLVALLRDPVKRAWSHYLEQRRRDQEPLDEFAAALEAEDERAKSSAFALEHLTYRLQGEYVLGLRPWVERFGRDRLLVMQSEHFYRDVPAGLSRVAEFVGLPHFDGFEAEQRNATSGPSLDPAIAERLQAHYRPLRIQLEELLEQPFDWQD